MPDQFSPEVPMQAADVERVAAEVKRHQENPEHRLLTGHEIIKKSIQSITGPTVQTQTSAQNDADSVLPAYAQAASPQTKQEIEHLLGAVFRDGLAKASEEAITSNPFVLDAFHDALTGRLYPELKKRGIVE